MLDRPNMMLTKPSVKHKNNTHIAVVLDRSGSMETMAKEIIGGFNGFLEEQKEVPGTATMTLVQFDDQIDRLATFKPLTEIKPLDSKTYIPRGATKLYDAIGLTVNSVRDEIEKQKKKPDKILVLILTDGQENSSQEYNTERIKSLLEAQQKDGWEFSFIGANQDAILTARGIGLSNAMSNITYAATPTGAMNMMASMSSATTQFRCANKGVAFAYSQEDRDAQKLDPASAGSFSHNSVFSEHGHIAGKLGGLARAASLSQKQRATIASNAAKARWSNRSV